MEVLGISMEGKELPVDPEEFQLRSDSMGGFAIDSRFALAYLVQNAYNVVRAEIVKYLQAYNQNPMEHPELPQQLCMMSSQLKINYFHH